MCLSLSVFSRLAEDECSIEVSAVKLGRLAKLSNMKYELSNSILICSFVDSQLVDKIEYLNFQLLVISDFLKLKHVE